jgi:hypothetical protein
MHACIIYWITTRNPLYSSLSLSLTHRLTLFLPYHFLQKRIKIYLHWIHNAKLMTNELMHNGKTGAQRRLGMAKISWQTVLNCQVDELNFQLNLCGSINRNREWEKQTTRSEIWTSSLTKLLEFSWISSEIKAKSYFPFSKIVHFITICVNKFLLSRMQTTLLPKAATVFPFRISKYLLSKFSMTSYYVNFNVCNTIEAIRSNINLSLPSCLFIISLRALYNSQELRSNIDMFKVFMDSRCIYTVNNPVMSTLSHAYDRLGSLWGSWWNSSNYECQSMCKRCFESFEHFCPYLQYRLLPSWEIIVVDCS